MADLKMQAIKLASAIKQVESGGNYDAKGASGESGAYQFMPDTWKSWAGKHLGNPNAPLTPANQNEVAVRQVYDLLQKHQDPRKVALIWNGGQPIEKKGVNSKGVAYDSGAYADKVTSTLNNMLSKKNMSTTTTSPTTAIPLADKSASAKLPAFADAIDAGRKGGKTDTDLLNKLSEKSPKMSEAITQLRQKAENTGRSDREVLNYLSTKLSGKMPSVESVPLVQPEPYKQEPSVIEQYKGAFHDLLDIELNRFKNPISDITGDTTMQEIGTMAKPLNTAVDKLFSGIIKYTPDFIKEPIKEKLQPIVDSPEGQAILSTLAQTGKVAADMWNKYKETDPKNAKKLENAMESGKFAINVEGGIALKEGFKKVFNVGKDLVLGKPAIDYAGKEAAHYSKEYKKALDLYNKATDIRAPGLIKFESKRGKTLSEFLLDEQLPLYTDDIGKVSRLKPADTVAMIDERIPQLGQQMDAVLATDQIPRFDLNDLLKDGLKQLKADQKAGYMSGTDYLSRKADLTKLVEDEISVQGTNMVNGQQLNKIKQGWWNKGYTTTGAPSAQKDARMLGFKASDTISAGYDSEVVKTLNSRMADYITAKDTLISMAGKTITGGGQMSSSLNKILGAVIFSKIPVVGPAIGAKIGEVLTKALNNPEILTMKAIKELQRVGMMPAYLDSLEVARDWLIKEGKNYVQKEMNILNKTLNLPPAPEGYTNTIIVPNKGGTPSANYNLPGTGPTLKQSFPTTNKFGQPIDRLGRVIPPIIPRGTVEARPGQLQLPAKAGGGRQEPIILSSPGVLESQRRIELKK